MCVGPTVLSTKGEGGEPRTIVAGDEDIVRGIDDAVLSMVKGEIASFNFSPAYGFGVEGDSELKVPPTATLVGVRVHFELDSRRLPRPPRTSTSTAMHPS